MVGLALSQHSLLAQERIPARTGQTVQHRCALSVTIRSLGHSELLCGSEEEKKKKERSNLTQRAPQRRPLAGAILDISTPGTTSVCGVKL